jgi:cation:H+ antiporter
VTVAQAADMALGNALGSCVLNLMFLVLMDILSGKQTVWSRAGPGHLLAGAFSVALLGFTLMGLLMGQGVRTGGAYVPDFASTWGFDLASPIMLGLYFIAIRTLWFHERSTAAGSVQSAVSQSLATAASPAWPAGLPSLAQALIVAGGRFSHARCDCGRGTDHVGSGHDWTGSAAAKTLAGRCGLGQFGLGGFVSFERLRAVLV